MTRRSLALTLALASLAALLAPATSEARNFTLGISAGDVRSTSALLWTRADVIGPVTVVVSRDNVFGDWGDVVQDATARAETDRTLTVRVGGLRPGTAYLYRFFQGSRKSAVGHFRTAPSPSDARPFRFAYTGDADAQHAKGQSKPFYNNFEVYRRMVEEGNAFNVNLGDTIYSDSEVGSTIKDNVFHPGFPPATTLTAKFAKYRNNLALTNLRRVRAGAGMFNLWDDHEFINDFTPPEMGQAAYRTGRDAFLAYMPSRYTGKDRLYRTVRWGKNAELFFPDERSFRSAKASANHVCDNPQTHTPDAAPMLPPNKRALFSVLVPSLSAPVSPACIAKINDPKRTFLGKRQLGQLEGALKRSKATFKIVVNETPILQQYAFPYDQWEGYAAERAAFLRFLKNNVKNVLFISTDTHAVLVSDARIKTLEPGGPVDTGITDFVTGPVATRTWDTELAVATGNSNAGDSLRSVFYKPPPPDGIGMPCANLDVYSYTEVRVTSSAVTLTPKDLNGHRVQDKNKSSAAGPPCGPFTIARK
jgi:alkaline phosphatase D